MPVVDTPEKAETAPYVLDDISEAQDSEQDTKLIELLQLINEYEKLANDSLRHNFINGHLNLSRANYNSPRKFGTDSLDLRPYQACKVVGKNFELIDKLALQKLLKKEKATMKDNEKKPESEGALRNRKTKIEKEETVSVSEEDEVTLKDPVLQFGGLVPYQLREAQANFSAGLSDALRLHTLRCKITAMVDIINSAT